MYFDYANREQTAEKVVASLLKQLLIILDQIPPIIKTKYENYLSGAPRPIFSDFVKLLISCIKESPKVTPVMLFDAFDECSSDQQSKIFELIDQLSKANIKVYITTRPHILDYLERLEGSEIMEIQADDEDIKTFLKDKLQITRRRIQDDSKEKIVRVISSKAQGM
jgi:hypothetical protein